MGIAFKAVIVDIDDNELLAQFNLSNYRAFRYLLNEEDDCAGEKQLEIEETLTLLKEVKEAFTQQGYPQDHHGPSTCAFLEKYLQTFPQGRVILHWG